MVPETNTTKVSTPVILTFYQSEDLKTAYSNIKWKGRTLTLCQQHVTPVTKESALSQLISSLNKMVILADLYGVGIKGKSRSVSIDHENITRETSTKKFKTKSFKEIVQDKKVILTNQSSNTGRPAVSTATSLKKIYELIQAQELPEKENVKTTISQADEKDPSSDPHWLKQPVEYTLIPSSTSAVLKMFKDIKKALINSKNVKFKLNDNSITFFHSEEEVRSILNTEGFPNALSPKGYDIRESILTKSSPGAISMSPETTGDFEKKELDLKNRIKKFFKENTTDKDVYLDSTINQNTLISSLLQKYEGICFGEVHHDTAPKMFLIENMKEFRNQGVTTLFMEHLFYDSTQSWLDDYFNAPKDAPMNKYLAAFLESMSARFFLHDKRYNFKTVIESAKAAGIRVVALDTTVSYNMGTDPHSFGVVNSESRYKSMNFVANTIIQREKKEGKFIALMGSGHAGCTQGVPGVSNLLAIPSVVVEGIDEPLDKLTLNVRNFKKGIRHIGAFLQIPCKKS